MVWLFLMLMVCRVSSGVCHVWWSLRRSRVKRKCSPSLRLFLGRVTPLWWVRWDQRRDVPSVRVNTHRCTSHSSSPYWSRWSFIRHTAHTLPVRIIIKSLFCSPGLHVFAQKYSKIVKYYYNLSSCFLCEYLLKYNLSKLYFQHHCSLQCHMIFQKSFAAQESFLIIINVENSCAAQYFCGNGHSLCFCSVKMH